MSGGIPFTYDDPASWSTLPHCEACAGSSSTQQSPIDVTPYTTVDDVAAPVCSFAASVPLLIYSDEGHTAKILIDQKTPSTTQFRGVTYAVDAIHFHRPSEHAIDGYHGEMSMHIVHRSLSDSLLVLAVFLYVTGPDAPDNPTLAPMFDNLANLPTTKPVKATLAFPFGGLQPVPQAFYFYNGSLTTPPCTTGVSWIIATSGQPVSQSQVAKFTAVFPKSNARPLQTRNTTVGLIPAPT
jgi:carbonic anhydrase